MKQSFMRITLGLLCASALTVGCCACGGTPGSAKLAAAGSAEAVTENPYEEAHVVRASDETDYGTRRLRFLRGQSSKTVTNPATIQEILDAIEEAPKESAPYDARYGGRLLVQIQGGGEESLSYLFVGNELIKSNLTAKTHQRYILDESTTKALESYYDALEAEESTYAMDWCALNWDEW